MQIHCQRLSANHPVSFEIAFTLDPPLLPVKGNIEFIDKNPDQLGLQIGRRTKNGLEESTLSCRTDNPAALEVWRKVADRLKNMTKAGITIVNRQSGDKRFYRSFRYTKGAEALEGNGVEMISPSGPTKQQVFLGN